ncbi:hypothetical protein V6N13_054106 [Hibiscus sabdariffa]
MGSQSQTNQGTAPVSSSAATTMPTESNSYVSPAPDQSSSSKSKMESVKDVLGKWGKKAAEDTKKAKGIAGNMWQHLKTGPSFADAAVGKIAQGTKVLAEGGYEKIFRTTFETVPDEQLLKTYACYLSTSSGPVLGVLYLSTQKLAFCSDSPLSYQAGAQTQWSYYKVVIPLLKLRAVNPSTSKANTAEKYIQIISIDSHEFWFMGYSVTIIHPEFNSPSPSNHHLFTFISIPDRLLESNVSLASGDFLNRILALNKNCVAPLKQFLQRMLDDDDGKHSVKHVAGVIYDCFMYFAKFVADDLGLPGFSMRPVAAAWLLVFFIPHTEQVLQPLELASMAKNSTDASTEMRAAMLNATLRSSGVILNTMEFFEYATLSTIGEYLPAPLFATSPFHKLALSSSSSLLQEDLQVLMEERKWKQMASNRELARRSRSNGDRQ